MSSDDHDRCRRCGAPDDGHGLAACDRNTAERLSAQERAVRRIPSPADLRPKPVDYGPRIVKRTAEAVRALRDSGGERAQIADDLPVVRGVASVLSEAGWVTRIERMDDGQTGLLYVVAPAGPDAELRK